jgi:hypothetical protein
MWTSVSPWLWDDDLRAFVTRTVPPPASLWDELRSERLVTAFGCLACGAHRTCPPVGPARDRLGFGILPPAPSADALSATLYGHLAWRPLSRAKC